MATPPTSPHDPRRSGGLAARAARRERLISQALRDALKGKLALAADSYREIVDDDPFDLQARLKLGDVLVQMNDVAGATQQYLACASIYDAQGFYLKAVAVLKQVERWQKAPQPRCAFLYARLGLESDALAIWRRLAEAQEAVGRFEEAAPYRELLADDDADEWMRGVARHAVDEKGGGIHVRSARVAGLADAPQGFRAAVLSAARRGYRAIEIHVEHGPVRVVEVGACRWFEGPTGALVHVGDGAFRREPDPVRALGFVVAEALTVPSTLDALVIFTALGGTAQLDGEPPHVENNAVVFAGLAAGGHPVRIRIDGETLGVSTL